MIKMTNKEKERTLQKNMSERIMILKAEINRTTGEENWTTV